MVLAQKVLKATVLCGAECSKVFGRCERASHGSRRNTSDLLLLDPSGLGDVYCRRFDGTDKERFEFLWCEITGLCRGCPTIFMRMIRRSDRCAGSGARLAGFAPNPTTSLLFLRQ
jgi:hypothetical protein